ncbi:unnamed protein product [Clonostachys rosea]|uniref:Ketoreductase (KR) domain-containing protein n=1 Tax=Bionectria ochroleuca TaxID=29856 RepID=A0ABY6V0R8_BIOOC|nr:unnamed protein product [Clonostachys rosea]
MHPTIRCGKGGIGHALALEFKSKGFLVLATLLAHEERTHLEEKQIYCFTADVTSEEDTVKLVASVMSVTGDTLNILVNNALES